jgi:hypothetical protein
MTNPPPPELFPQRPIRSDFTGDRRPYLRRRIATVILLFAVILGGIYLKFGRAPEAPAEIPTITAEGPLKEKPDQPGGIPIPNQDVTAYQQIDNSGASTKPEAEHLLPPPETPQAPPATAPAAEASPAAPKIETLDLPPPPKLTTTVMVDNNPSPAAPAPAAAPLAPVQKAENIEANPPSPAVAPVPATQPVTTPATPPSATPAATAPKPASAAPTPATKSKAVKETATAGKGGYSDQLASIPDEESAQTDAKKLQAEYAAILGKSHLQLVKADLGARGIYYRVQSGSLGDKEAHDMCAALKNAGGACIVVRP